MGWIVTGLAWLAVVAGVIFLARKARKQLPPAPPRSWKRKPSNLPTMPIMGWKAD